MKNKKHLEVAPPPPKTYSSKGFSGFTLAETLIVLVVLGIVASLTIPPLVRRQIEAANRVKIKKAMGVYDTLLAKIAVENDIKSNAALKEWGEQGGECANQRNYFKVVKGEGCQFMTADKVWLDVSDITHPKIALKEGELNTDSKTTFTLLGHFGQNGELRVDDLAYEEQNATGADLIAITNLYSYMNNDESLKIAPGSTKFLNTIGAGSSCSSGYSTSYDYDSQGRITSVNCRFEPVCEYTPYGELCTNPKSGSYSGAKTISYDDEKSEILIEKHCTYVTLDGCPIDVYGYNGGFIETRYGGN